MSDANESSANPAGQPGPEGGVSIARRHALLKGLGKGAALAGASVPLAGLAASGQRMKLVKTNGTAVLCSISGNMSVLVSVATTSLTQCSGNTTSHYKSTTSATSRTSTPTWSNWPGQALVALRGPNNTFKSVFGTSVRLDGIEATLGKLINLNPPTDQSYWVMALLNAYASPAYPYSPGEVITQYKSGRAGALSFHKLVAGYA